MVAVDDGGDRGWVSDRVRAEPRLSTAAFAIAGRNETDAVDADMLAGRCEDVLSVDDAPVPLVGQVGLRRALTRRHHMVCRRSPCRVPPVVAADLGDA